MNFIFRENTMLEEEKVSNLIVTTLLEQLLLSFQIIKKRKK